MAAGLAELSTEIGAAAAEVAFVASFQFYVVAGEVVNVVEHSSYSIDVEQSDDDERKRGAGGRWEQSCIGNHY